MCKLSFEKYLIPSRQFRWFNFHTLLFSSLKSLFLAHSHSTFNIHSKNTCFTRNLWTGLCWFECLYENTLESLFLQRTPLSLTILSFVEDNGTVRPRVDLALYQERQMLSLCHWPPRRQDASYKGTNDISDVRDCPMLPSIARCCPGFPDAAQDRPMLPPQLEEPEPPPPPFPGPLPLLLGEDGVFDPRFVGCHGGVHARDVAPPAADAEWHNADLVPLAVLLTDQGATAVTL